MSLQDHLLRLIEIDGPMTVARYMHEVLQHPDSGYYRRDDIFGADGDFITAPEISQMFGELIGLWCASCWQTMGAPARVNLIELGPGRGILMADLLRAADMVPEFAAAIDLHLVETSEKLRDIQAAALPNRSPRWHDALPADLKGPSIVVANEFLDALPIHQFQAVDGRWYERMVGRVDDTLAFVLAPNPTPLARRAEPGGSILELAPAREAAVGSIAAHADYALIVDYGFAEPGLGDTLQAVRRHRFHDPLTAPGTADLTSHVDFHALSGGAEGAACWGPVSQRDFLFALGIRERAATLRRAATGPQRETIDRAVARLTDAAQMGTLFKVLAITPPNAPAPAGFEELS